MRSFAQAPSAESTRRGNGGTFSFGLFATMLVCAAAFLGIGAPAASAAPVAGPGWSLRASFTAPFVSFEAARNPIATGGTGNIFLADQNAPSVKVLSPDPTAGGVPLTEVPILGYDAVRNVAVDPADDTLYADSVTFFGRPGVITRYTSDGQATPTYTQDVGFEIPRGEGMAVDTTTHDLLVADAGAEAVLRYDTSGTLLDSIATPIAPAWIATRPDGTFYVASEAGPDIVHLAGDGTVLETIAGAGALQGLTWDTTREILVASVGDKFKNYSSAGALLSEPPAQTSEGTGLAFDSANELLYQDSLFTAYAYYPAVYPGVEAPVVSDISNHGAHLSADVDPGSGPPTPIESKGTFEYSGDGGATWKKTPSQDLSGPTTLEADLTDLFANFDYLVRVRVSNSLMSNVSAATPFSTPVIAPEVLTAKATDVSETSAVLNATVNPSGLQTTYHFEYGLTDAYGSRVPAGIEAVAGNGYLPRAFSRTITGLEPGTTYHFRIVAENSEGISEGDDETFTTIPTAGTPHRAYEQVTPADKKGIAIESGFGFFAKADGEAMAYLTKGGGAGAPLNARSLTFRGADDWEPGPDLDPPVDVLPPPGILTQGTLGLSADFTKAFVPSNKKLTPDAADNPAANLYLYDVASGEYTLVGSTPPLSFALNTYTGFGVGGNLIAGAPDFSWIVFYSGLPLIENAPYNALYRWSETDGLEIVSILPGPSETPATVFEQDAYSHVLPWTSVDGSRIYFQSVEPEPGIYLRENGETKPVSVSEVPGEPTGPRPALLLGTSEDGRYAFLGITESNVKLTADAPGEYGDAYRYDASDGSLEYLGAALLSGGASMFHSALSISPDGETFFLRSEGGTKVWREGTLKTISPLAAPSELSSGSPNGRYLAFAGSEGGALYLYDAVTEELDCASCFPDGTPGKAFLPNLINRTIGVHLPRAVSNSGQFFFTSSSRLVAADANGVNDVYEYKDGKAKLVSPGNAPFPATFADISEDGRDVFFTTQQKLVGRDNDGTVDIYDARIDGGLPAQSPPAPQECLRDDCKATPNAGPELPFGGSEALSGPENVKPPKQKKCGKGKKPKKVKGKVRCVKKHKANKNKKGGNR